MIKGFLLSIAAAVALAGCASMEKDNAKPILLIDAPAAARIAAEAAVEGIVLTEAEVEEEDGQTVYEFEGVANGKEYEIEVTAEGKVLEVEEDKD